MLSCNGRLGLTFGKNTSLDDDTGRGAQAGTRKVDSATSGIAGTLLDGTRTDELDAMLGGTGTTGSGDDDDDACWGGVSNNRRWTKGKPDC